MKVLDKLTVVEKLDEQPNATVSREVIERLVKSAERIRDLGEVFTPSATVQTMLDLIPEEMWRPHPSATFFEPTCGDGNFLIGVLERKLANVARAYDAETLPAGTTLRALQFHALQALASIYAVDISADNVIGGTPGHEVGARDRLLSHLKAWYEAKAKIRTGRRSAVLLSAKWIVERNILIGNMLATNADGTRSDLDTLPLIEYDFSPTKQQVLVSQTTLGAVMAASSAEVTGVVPLFAVEVPSVTWRGRAISLHLAPITAPTPSSAFSRNGKERRA